MHWNKSFFVISLILAINQRVLALKSMGIPETNKTYLEKVTKIIGRVDKVKKSCNFLENRLVLLDEEMKSHHIINDLILTLSKSKNCHELYTSGYHTSGVYSIWLTTGFRFLPIYCDMDTPSVYTNKRGWMVIQRRFNGKLDFNRNWQEYVDGFGSPYGEYWLGLENIHQLANYLKVLPVDNLRILRIDLTDIMNYEAYSEYRRFGIHGSDELYKAKLIPPSPQANTPQLTKNMLSIHFNHFSTFDNNNQEIKILHNCAKEFGGGWWFLGNCEEVNLNGNYPLPNSTVSMSNIYWEDWDQINPLNAALVKVSMKMQ